MKKFLKAVSITAVTLVIVIAAFIAFISIEGPHSDVSAFSSDLNALSPRQASIDGFGVAAQPDAASCGAATISMVESYFSGKEVSPESLIRKYGLNGGMDPDRFLEILSDEGYDAEYKAGLGDLDLLEEIHSQISKGAPVAVFFGAENPYNEPYYDFHASVVTGIDLGRRTVDIANAYGYYETITLDEFLDRMSYRETGKYPLVQKAVLKLGLVDTNAIFIFKR